MYREAQSARAHICVDKKGKCHVRRTCYEVGGGAMKKKVLFAILIVMLLIGGIMVVRYKTTPEEVRILQSLYSLDGNIDAKGLEKKGYVDVSEVKGENPDITKFLKTLNGDFNKSVLRAFTVKDNRITVKVYFYDPKWKLIRSWTYSPRHQEVSAPDKRFSTKYVMVTDEDKVSVKLRNVKNLSISDTEPLSDEILYSYYKK